MSDADPRNIPSSTSAPGLPPVAPPSGRFILQMFLVPGLIIALIVGGCVGFRWVVSGPHTPEKFLRGLDDPNPEVRWRTAADLAQVLPRKLELAVNARFALALTERLQKAVTDNRISEEVRAKQLKAAKDEPPPASRTLRSEREYIWYLIGCLGNFQVPVATSLLQELTLDRSGSDPEIVFRRRLIAVTALTVLGNNLKKFDRLPEDKREKLLEELKDEAAGTEERARWAGEALSLLEARQAGKPAAKLKVGDTLAELARDPSPFMRKNAALALTYWDGDKAEAALFRLIADDGGGDDPIKYADEIEQYRKDHPGEVRKQNQKDIVYNAALTLARRGSARAEELFDVYEEMLDLKRQEAIWASEDEKQQSSLDARIVSMAVNALNALDQLHHHRPEIHFVPSALDNLVENDNKALHTTALELRNKLK